MAGHDETVVVHEHADEWHHHTAAEGKPQHEHAGVANTSALFHWLILILISGITVIIALSMYFGKYYNTIRQERIETLQFYKAGTAPRDKAEGDLGIDTPLAHFTYHATADKAAHTVQLPIDQAMKTVVDRYGADAAKTPATSPTPAPTPPPGQPK